MKTKMMWGVQIDQLAPDGKGKETITRHETHDKNEAILVAQSDLCNNKGKVTRVKVLR